MAKDIQEYASVYGVDMIRADQAHYELKFLGDLKEASEDRLSTINSLNEPLKRRDALHKASIDENAKLSLEIETLRVVLKSKFALLRLLVNNK